MVGGTASHSPEIVVVGGGTGSFGVLKELKDYIPTISAVVNMSDDGGSSGILRRELDVMPPGDVRQCLTALSNEPDIRDMFSYRFPPEGEFAGHSLGNLILAGFERTHDSFTKAVQIASNMLRITGQVVPATLDKHTLVMKDGTDVIRGEYEIAHRKINETNPALQLDPPAAINPKAREVISEADVIIIAPGNLYGSLLPIFAVEGISEAIAESKAQKVSITNLLNKPGQTDGWHVVDYVKQFEKHIGDEQVDVVLYNNEPIETAVLSQYAAKGEYPVFTEEVRFSEITAKAIGARLVAKEIVTPDPHDTAIQRTLIRHDAEAISAQVLRLLYEI